MEYYQILKDLREDAGYKQSYITDLLNTSQSYYSEYELGKRQMPIKHLITLCRFYGVSADYVLGLPRGLDWPR